MVNFFKTQRKFALVFVLCLVVFGLTACSSGESATDDNGQVIELKLAHFFPATHPAETDLIQPWIEAVKEATDGKVVITSYPAETLAKAPDTYDAVVSGIADLGMSCFSYTAGRFPVSEVFELPGVTYKNSEVASQVAWEGIQELNPEEVQDTKLMMVIATGPGDLFTNTPVTKLEDLKGMQIRATGISATTLEALGAAPVAMAQSEAYESLSKGVVQGNLSPDEVLQGWKQAEVCKYVTKTPFLYNTLFFLTMNLDKWNSLPADVQQAIEGVNQKYFDEVGAGLWDMQDEAAVDYAKDQGVEFVNLTDEEAARWKELLTPIQDQWVQKVDAMGLNGEDILNTVEGLADKYNQETE